MEIDLTARIADVEVATGHTVRAWTYDGGIPGPLIRAHVGDRVIVHFTNDLPQPTTIHWHGVRVPIEMDGVPDVSQPEVKRGETFTYDFVVRDAGLYWYHPHVMSAAQVGFGLYGALLVEDPADGVGVADQLTLVLSDIGFDRHGVLDSPDTGGPAGMVFGREGAYVLANGKILPTLRARSGAPQRWRIVNAAKSRFFLLDLEGQTFYVIGSDGGLQERPETTDSLLITPGERVDVIVTPTGPRRRDAHAARGVVQPRLRQRRISHSRRCADDCVQRRATTAETAACPRLHRDIVAPSLAGATRVDVVLTLPPAGPDGKSEFQVNGVPFWKANAVSREGRRDADLDREERDEVGAPDASARLLLPAAGRAAPTDPPDGVEGHARRADRRARSALSWCSTSGPACGCSIATSWTTRTAA